MEQVPVVVQRAFNVYIDDSPQSASEALSEAWDGGVRVGDLVVSRVADVERANWSAKTRETIVPSGVRLARPIRSTDGRFIVSGWRVNEYSPGEIHARADEVVAAAVRLGEAMAALPVPHFASREVATSATDTDLFDLADRAAWSDNPSRLLAVGLTQDTEATALQQVALENAAQIVQRCHDVPGAPHVCHADMFATTVTSGGATPVVTDLVCVAHPTAYTAAMAMVDAMIAGVANADILERFSFLRDIEQLVFRALLYRLYLHALHPHANSNNSARLTGIVRQLL